MPASEPAIQPAGEDMTGEQSSNDSLRALLESVNIAEKLHEQELKDIGEQARRGFETDLNSRREWERNIDDWMKLAQQVKEQKSYPWPRASNIKYPLLSTAAMQFAARAYPSLVPSDGKIVKTQVVGKDPDGSKEDLAERIAIYMSYQLMHEMHGWEEDMDKLLIMLPIVGTMFKKTYWDPIKKKNCSRLILPKNLVVNYWTQCLEDAERISEVIEMSPRILKERMMAGIFLEKEFGPANASWNWDNIHPDVPPNDETTPFQIIEQHTFLDLDKDGYKEPYIVTFNRQTGDVLRITTRFDEKTMFFSDDGKLQAIEPIHYYTKFSFVPAPDGSFYDIGFGMLLGPINESVNTLINLLVDAGHLSNLQSGFIGKGLQLRMGETRFQPGEWKAVNATGGDLKNQVVPLPVKEPSAVLFQLMGTLVTSGKELASVAEIFVGKMPGQNTPATTTMATIEQGMKVFTAVYKRIYRSLESEFLKLFNLNATYLDYNTYAEVVDVQVDPNDFKQSGFKVVPGADPNAVSQSEKLIKAQGLMELLQVGQGILNPVAVISRVLQAQEQPNWEELLDQQVAQTGQSQPQPDPKILALQQKGQFEGQRLALKQQDQAFKQALATHDQATQQAMAQQAAQTEQTLQAASSAAQSQQEYQANNVRIAQEAAHQQQALHHAQQTHEQKMHQSAEQHRQKMEHSKSQQRATSKRGKSNS
ncbi:MAG: hypothetical protein KGI54_14255 [Pseudomonadota bacterium]|nr:hypothetical protein [Pseudomonadota bacterium]